MPAIPAWIAAPMKMLLVTGVTGRILGVASIAPPLRCD
jgi:hypothetical protein